MFLPCSTGSRHDAEALLDRAGSVQARSMANQVATKDLLRATTGSATAVHNVHNVHNYLRSNDLCLDKSGGEGIVEP